jgi:hypothetical protein
MFLGRPIDKSLFFTNDAKPFLHVSFSEKRTTAIPNRLGVKGVGRKQLLVNHTPFRKSPTSYSFAWQGALATANACIDVLEREIKGRGSGEKAMIRPALSHCCCPLRRDAFVELWKHTKIQPILERTRTSVFRKVTDVHTIFMASMYLLLHNRATYYANPNPKGRDVSVAQKKPSILYTELASLKKAVPKLLQGTTDFYCLNDAHDLPIQACLDIVKLIKTNLPHHHKVITT